LGNNYIIQLIKTFFYNICKNKKALQQRPKGRKLSGSLNCSIGRTFTSTYYFPHKKTKTNQTKRLSQNPFYLTRKYRRMIDGGQLKSQYDLARKFGISRARIHQILHLLKLNLLIFQELEKLGDPLLFKFKSFFLKET